MDIEFHYYLTYLIAAKAGFNPNESAVIAGCCQLTDDNTAIYEINKNKTGYYTNYISQTADITKPKKELFRIYSHFHFLPGEPEAVYAGRKDGKMHWLNTTPASKNAHLMFGNALKTNNLYRIGIACHVLADTFAHQNFVGYYDSFNSMNGVLEEVIPNIGHAKAITRPDWPALIWVDNRLLSEYSTVYNKERFLAAAKELYTRLRKYKLNTISDKQLQTEADLLADIFDKAIGLPDDDNSEKDERINRYKQLSQTSDFGGRLIPEYNEYVWLDEAVVEDTMGIIIKSGSIWDSLNPFPETFTWKDSANYTETNWYKFQEAIKQHQNETWDILKAANFANVELEKI